MPHNHSDIMNEDNVIRRVRQDHIIDDPKVQGGKRLSTLLIQESTEPMGGMSVDLHRPIAEAGLEPASFVITEPYVAAITLTAGEYRGYQGSVGYDPLPENPYHGEVWGKFSKGIKTRILKASQWLVPVEGIAAPYGPESD